MSITRKKQLVKEKIVANHGCGKGQSCPSCVRAHWFIDKMSEYNIPFGYWFLRKKDFAGSNKLRESYEEYIDDLDKNYMDGKSLCFVGNQGTGKTLSAIFILKAAILRNYSCYYITASDLFNEMTAFGSNHDIRKKLTDVDFLVIDELDSRFFPSDAQKELFSSIYENIFRNRSHNLLPTIICTNETNDILSVFHGAGVQSIKSLNKQYLNIIPVVGTDYRKRIADGSDN